MRLVIITKEEEEFLNVFVRHGFDKYKMKRFIDNPELVDKVANLLIAKDVPSQIDCTRACSCPKCEHFDRCF